MVPTPQPATIQAPCKINPTLVVIERRPDGYHELDLTYLALDLCDRVRLTPAMGRAGQVRMDGPMFTPDIPSDERNLARRALSLALEIGRADGLDLRDVDFDIQLTKGIPSQAGLGGGSADAAAALLGACGAIGLSPDDPRVLSQLAQLGSDCSFFLRARDHGHARGLGRGERIEALPPPSARFVVAILTPGQLAPTSVVYGALGALANPEARRARGQASVLAWVGARTLEELRAALVNDLEAAALRALPELALWRSILDEQGCEHFRLAGSGASFFGLFSDARLARVTLDRIEVSAAARGVTPRGSWVARPAGHGARPVGGPGAADSQS